MESLFSLFLLFVAALTAILTYMFVPYIPIVALIMAAAIALAAGVWWHWTQFAVDYRTSTWQEQLRNYASYVIILLVILLSYAFYVFAYSGSSLQEYAAQAAASIRDAGRRATSRVISSSTRALSSASDALFSEVPAQQQQQPQQQAAPINRRTSTNLLV